MKIYLVIFALFMAMVTLQTIHYLQFQDEVSKWINKGPRFRLRMGRHCVSGLRRSRRIRSRAGIGGSDGADR